MVSVMGTSMTDQIIDAVMAQRLQADARRSHHRMGWIVMRDQPDYPDGFVARLISGVPTPYVLLADSLDGLQVQLPVGLECAARQLVDPPEVAEIWFAA